MRWTAGLLLVGAAVLKAAQLVNEPSTAFVHPLGHLFLPVQIGLEFALGLLVLSGVYWRVMRWLILSVYAGFAGYSVYLAINGAASCGCFGALHIHPWWTFLLDAVIALGLWIS